MHEPIDFAAIHASALVLDTHADTPQRFLDEGWDFTSVIGTGHLNLATARAGNLAGEFFALWVDPAQCRAGLYAHRTLALLEAIQEQIRRHPAELALCTSPAEIVAARAGGRFAAVLAIEGGHSIENSVELLRLFHSRGVRLMTLTWANSNVWAESSGDAAIHPADTHITAPTGLTSFGQEVVEEMNRLGMIVDTSHASDRTLTDVLACTRAPILASHSNARALCDSPRNLTDDQIRAIAASGGAVMINFYAAFVDEGYRLALHALKPERAERHRALALRYGTEPIPFHASNAVDRAFVALLPRPPFSSLVAQFEHVIEIAGIDHVGIGTDFDGISALPEGIESAADLPKITSALAARGHSAEDLHKLLGGNLMRVFAAVQDVPGTA